MTTNWLGLLFTVTIVALGGGIIGLVLPAPESIFLAFVWGLGIGWVIGPRLIKLT